VFATLKLWEGGMEVPTAFQQSHKHNMRFFSFKFYITASCGRLNSLLIFKFLFYCNAKSNINGMFARKELKAKQNTYRISGEDNIIF